MQSCFHCQNTKHVILMVFSIHEKTCFAGILLVLWLAHNVQAEVTGIIEKPPVNNVAWEAESKTTNVMAGLDYAEYIFCFTNLSAMPLTVISVHTSCGCTTAQLPPLPWTVPAGTNGQIGVRVNLAGKSGTVTKTITVGTDQGIKTLLVKIIIEPPGASAMSATNRLQNMQISQTNRQAVFHGDCASCHIKSIDGQYAKQLFDAVCGVCHETAHRATMVPDLHTLNVPTDELFWRTWISYGRPGSLMPAFAKTENGPLTDMQIASLAAYLNSVIPSHITNSFQ
jgi:mono/diheme cytochrome c family protein